MRWTLLLLVWIASPSAASWTVEPIPRSEDGLPAFETACPVERWHHDAVKVRGRRILSPICADLRGDGRERMYAQLEGGPLVELELHADGPRTSWVLIEKLTGLPFGPRLAVARASAASRPALFVADMHWISMLSWNGRGWDIESTRQRDARPVNELAAGDARGGGETRLYAVSPEGLAEYSRTPVGWRRQGFPIGLASVRRLHFARLPGEERARLMIETKDGRYALRWKSEGRVAVLDFTGHGLSSGEAAGFSDLVRARLFQIGNCGVVERSELEPLLREQSLQSSGLIAPESAVKLGKLLKAERVVIGSLGREGERRFADARIVSPRTGAAERAEVVTWADKAEMEAALELLAQAACPDAAAAR